MLFIFRQRFSLGGLFYKGSKKIKEEDIQAKMDQSRYEFEASYDGSEDDQSQAGMRMQ